MPEGLVVVVVVKAWRQELNCSRRAPGYFTLIGETRLHLPHAIEVGLHVRKSNVVILTPETAGTLGV